MVAPIRRVEEPKQPSLRTESRAADRPQSDIDEIVAEFLKSFEADYRKRVKERESD
jgi:hypothetical protein